MAAPQIAALYVRDLLLHDASPLEQIVERLFHRIRIPVEQLRRRRHELFPRQKHVSAALLVVAQLKSTPASVRQEESPEKPIDSAISSDTEKSTPNASPLRRYGLRRSASIASAP